MDSKKSRKTRAPAGPARPRKRAGAALPAGMAWLQLPGLDRKLREALTRWAELPIERRQSVVDYWMTEVREQLDYARAGGDTNEAASARLWAEENLVVLDLLQAVAPTPYSRRPRGKKAPR